MGGVRWTKKAGPVEIVKISVGGMDNNVYLVSIGDRAVLVDGGSDELDTVLGVLGDRELSAILQTHNHGDHTRTLRGLVEKTNAPVLAHPDDAGNIPVKTQDVADGETIHLVTSEFKVVHTPGHTPGGVCFLLEEAGERHLFAGDTLFPGGPGNTFNNAGAFKTIMRSLEEKLFVLPDDTHVYPGHGSDTTIGAERPHLQEWRTRGW